MGGGYFEFNEPRASTCTKKKKQESENVSSTKKSDVLRPTANLPFVDLKDYNITEKTIHYIKVYHVTEKPKTKNTRAEDKLRKADFNFVVDLKTLIHKILVDLKLLQLKICLRKSQKKRPPQKILPFSMTLANDLVFYFAVVKYVMIEELKKQVVEALHVGHPGSSKMLADSNILWWSRKKKKIENKGSTWTTCIICGKKNVKYQLTSTEKFKLLVLTETGQEIQTEFPGKPPNKHVTGPPYILIGIDRYDHWLVVRLCKSTEAKEVIRLLEKFVNFNGVQVRMKSD